MSEHSLLKNILRYLLEEVFLFLAVIVCQIPEFITFEDRLDNSLQRDIVKLEHLRMRVTHETITSDLIDMELIELKFIVDRGKTPCPFSHGMQKS